MNKEGMFGQLYSEMVEDYIRTNEKSFLFTFFKKESEEKARTYFELLGEAEKDSMYARLMEIPKKKRADSEAFDIKNTYKKDIYTELQLRYYAVEEGRLAEPDYYIWLLRYINYNYKTFTKSAMFFAEGDWLSDVLDAVLPDRKKEAEMKNGQEKEPSLKSELTRACALLEAKEHVEAIRKRLEALQNVKKADKAYSAFLADKTADNAIHVKVKDYMEYSGFPLRKQNSGLTLNMYSIGSSEEKPKRKSEKRDFSLKLIAAFCESKGYVLKEKNSGDAQFDINARLCYRISGTPQEIREKIKEITDELDKKDVTPSFFYPLVSHQECGCVMGIFGKGNYDESYKELMEQKSTSKINSRYSNQVNDHSRVYEKYQNTEKNWCFDFMEFDGKEILQISEDEYSPNDFSIKSRPYRLRPRFHEYAGRGYESVLNDFKRYCAAVSDEILDMNMLEFDEDSEEGSKLERLLKR